MPAPTTRWRRRSELFGDLVDDERFTTAYRQTLESFRTRGARATLARLLNG